MDVENATAQPDESCLKLKDVKKRKERSVEQGEEEWIRQFDLLDAALKCSICYECIDTPLLVRTCGHSFCAGCIRQNLEFQGKKSGSSCCPTCRKQCDTRDLVVNTMLRGVVERYDVMMRLFGGKDGGKADGLVDLIRSNLGALNQGAAGQMVHVDKGDGKGDEAGLPGNYNRTREIWNGKGKVDASRRQDVPRRNPSRRSKACRLKGKMELDAGAAIEILESDTEEAGPSSSFKENRLSHQKRFDDEEKEVPSNDDESSHEEFVPETDRDRGNVRSRNQGAVQKAQNANNNSSVKNDATTGSKFVHCPICGKSISEFFINSHVDRCLVDVDRQNANTTTEAGNPIGRSEAVEEKTEDGHADWAPLPVPPKFVGNLVTEKMIRASLRKYGVSTDGKKPELIDRYNKFRLEIEIANDKQEKTTYDKIASRISQKERVRAAASLLNKPVNSGSKRQINDSSMKPTGNRPQAQTNVLPDAQVHTRGLHVDFSKMSHPREIELHGSSFKDLIQVTLLRDRFRKQQRELGTHDCRPHEDRPCTSVDTNLPDKMPQQHDDEEQSHIPNKHALEAPRIEQELQDVEEIILNSENEDDIW